MADNPLGSVQGAPDVQAPNIPPPGMAPQMGVPPPDAMAQVAQPSPAAADTAHHTMLGKAFRSIMGNEVSYEVDPQTGKTVATPVESKPGQLWRSILAGVITGGATAAKEKAPGIAAGIVEGGAGAMEQKQAQDDRKRMYAQKQFEDQLKAQQNQRSQRSADTEDMMHKAQISLHNAQTLRENRLMQREDYAYHKGVSEDGMKDLKPFMDADMSLVKFKDIPEEQMHDIIKNNPEAGHNLMWRPTGTAVVFDKDGNPNVHATYSAVDPQGKVKITDSQVKRWEAAGMDRIYGNQWSVIKAGKELSASEYMAISSKALELNNANLLEKKNKQSDEEIQSKIDLQKAQAAHYYAAAKEIRKAGTEKTIKEKTFLEASDALEAAEKDGKGYDDLPIKYQDALDDHDQAKVKDKNDLLKTVVAGGGGGSKEAGDLYKDIENATKTRKQREQEKQRKNQPPPANSGLPAVNESSQSYIKDALSSFGQGNEVKAGDYLWNDNRVAPDQKLAITKQMGLTMPWSAVKQFSTKAGISPEVGATQLKQAGIKVAEQVSSQAEPTVDDGS